MIWLFGEIWAWVLAGFLLGLLNTALHNVTDRNNTNKFSRFINNRQMPEAVSGHHFHHVMNRIMRTAMQNLRGHGFRNRHLQSLNTVIGAGTHNIPLRKNSCIFPRAFIHQQCTNTVR